LVTIFELHTVFRKFHTTVTDFFFFCFCSESHSPITRRRLITEFDFPRERPSQHQPAFSQSRRSPPEAFSENCFLFFFFVWSPQLRHPQTSTTLFMPFTVYPSWHSRPAIPQPRLYRQLRFGPGPPPPKRRSYRMWSRLLHKNGEASRSLRLVALPSLSFYLSLFFLPPQKPIRGRRPILGGASATISPTHFFP